MVLCPQSRDGRDVTVLPKEVKVRASHSHGTEIRQHGKANSLLLAVFPAGIFNGMVITLGRIVICWIQGSMKAKEK